MNHEPRLRHFNPPTFLTVLIFCYHGTSFNFRHTHTHTHVDTQTQTDSEINVESVVWTAPLSHSQDDCNDCTSLQTTVVEHREHSLRKLILKQVCTGPK